MDKIIKTDPAILVEVFSQPAKVPVNGKWVELKPYIKKLQKQVKARKQSNG